jgi:hypothetical protein
LQVLYNFYIYSHHPISYTPPLKNLNKIKISNIKLTKMNKLALQ